MEISGFSKLDRSAKIEWLSQNYLSGDEQVANLLASFLHPDKKRQQDFDDLSENTVSNFHVPYGLAPNFLINDIVYCVPMVIEESSVVAAASSAAKFWLNRGGFQATVISTEKVGQVHFHWKGDPDKFNLFFKQHRQLFMQGIGSLQENMVERGGGLTNIELVNKTELDENYYQLLVSFETCDAMGANFINTILERLAQLLKDFALKYGPFVGEEREVEVIMSILSNYTPNCLVRSFVDCSIAEIGESFASRFCKAVKLAKIDPYRATTHNKGIFNGIDAVVLATGNDFRAVEACGHAYAARSGSYQSLTSCSIEDGRFHFEIEVPIALGTVGGLTTLHPLSEMSLAILKNPSASQLMMIAATLGLAQNFAALRSLVTTGIQQGHMKMHLKNILRGLDASSSEVSEVKKYFSDKIISHNAVRNFLTLLRGVH